MCAAGTLWTTPNQARGKAIKAVCALTDIKIGFPQNYEHFVDNYGAYYLSKFPHGKVPAWEGANGFRLFEGVAIARYSSLCPASGLLGSSLEEAALVDQWVHLSETEVADYTDLIEDLCDGDFVYNKTSHKNFTEHQIRALLILEAHIAKQTFFVGERITLADIFIASYIQRGVRITIDRRLRERIPNLIRHLNTIVNHPKLKEIFGETKFTDKSIQFVP